MSKKSLYFCKECGNESSGWLGKCPHCQAWNSFVAAPSVKKGKRKKKEGWIADREQKAQSLSEVSSDFATRFSSGISELDRVLGGGIVRGSLVLLGGDPGIGKSTILLQLLASLDAKTKSLYVSGEESPSQIKIRAERLAVDLEKIKLLCSNDFEAVKSLVLEDKPAVLVIDSIQTMYTEEVAGVAGSVTQVKEICQALLRLAKENGISVLIAGHVTKDGAIAGPRVLEHMVDTVLYFEGEMGQQYRILRCVKNRFGTTNEIGLFEMTAQGLIGIPNISQTLLEGRPIAVAGSVLTSILEGTRPLIIEIQALMTPTSFNQPLRMSQGVDRGRVAMLLAVLAKQCSNLSTNYDSYINVVGGLKVKETAVDLALVLAMLSSIRDIAVHSDTIICGELGLTGEVRSVADIARRVQEALRLGWKRFVLPAADQAKMKRANLNEAAKIYYVSNLREAIDVVFNA